MNDSNPKKFLDRYFPVLDHGFVALVDYMGDDEAIERAARVSYGKGTRSVRKTRGLIRYLMRHHHTTPIEQVELKFHVAMPIFVQRQFIRHRTFSVNEYSGRYSVMPETYYIPEQHRYGVQSKENRQGTGKGVPTYPYDVFKKNINSGSSTSFSHYYKYIEKGVARELARVNLPLNMYTELYFSVDLHNLFHFLNLRLDSHAQWEIRQYAEVIAGLTREVVPLAFEAFVDYQLNSYSLSRMEIEAVRSLGEGEDLREDTLEELGMSNREVSEFIDMMFNGGSRSNNSVDDFVLMSEEALSTDQARIRLHGEN